MRYASYLKPLEPRTPFCFVYVTFVIGTRELFEFIPFCICLSY